MPRSILTAPFLVFLWQSLPVGTAHDSTGRVRFSMGFGAGGYHSTIDRASCAGGSRAVSTKEGSWRSGSASVEVWPSATSRLTVAASRVFPGAGVAPRGGWTADGLLAAEWRWVGIGAGVAHGTGAAPFTEPLGYLRLGDRDAMHLRAEVVEADAPVASRTWLKIGAGYNLGRHPGAREFLGLALPWRREAGTHHAVFADVFAPLGHGATPLELTVSAQLGIGDVYHESFAEQAPYASWRFMAGLRYTIGR